MIVEKSYIGDTIVHGLSLDALLDDAGITRSYLAALLCVSASTVDRMDDHVYQYVLDEINQYQSVSGCIEISLTDPGGGGNLAGAG